jgi:hypothetical protein
LMIGKQLEVEEDTSLGVASTVHVLETRDLQRSFRFCVELTIISGRKVQILDRFEAQQDSEFSPSLAVGAS